MMRAAIIGSGFIGQQHAEAYAEIGDIKLVAIADANESAGRAAAEKFGCAYYQDAERMCRDLDLDFVDICLPTFLHARFAKAAAQNGKHVLCEKPFAITEADCAEMIEACRANHVKLMVAQCERWTMHIQDIRRRLAAGEIGNVHMVVTKRLAQHPTWTTWHRDPSKSGGGLFDLQVHDIDLLVHLFGEVERVSAIGWQNETRCWNHVSAMLTFKNGVQAMCEGSEEMIDGYPFSMGFRVTGDLGGAEYSFRGGFNNEKLDTNRTDYTVFHAGGEPEFPVLPDTNEYAAEIRAFAEAIRTDADVPISAEESLYVIRVTEAIRESLETGMPVKVKSK